MIICHSKQNYIHMHGPHVEGKTWKKFIWLVAVMFRQMQPWGKDLIASLLELNSGHIVQPLESGLLSLIKQNLLNFNVQSHLFTLNPLNWSYGGYVTKLHLTFDYLIIIAQGLKRLLVNFGIVVEILALGPVLFGWRFWDFWNNLRNFSEATVSDEPFAVFIWKLQHAFETPNFTIYSAKPTATFKAICCFF